MIAAARRTLALSVLVLVALLTARPAAAALSSAKVLGQLPDDVTSMAAVDIAAARKGDGFAAISAEVLRVAPDLASILTSGKLDALDLTSLIAGELPGGEVVSLLEGRLPPDLLDRTKYSAMTTDRGVTVYTIGGMEAAMLGKRLAMASVGQMRRLIDLHTGAKTTTSAKKGKRAAWLRKAAKATVTSRHGWAIARAQGSINSALAGVGIKASWISVSIKLGADTEIEARLELPSAADATRAAADGAAAIATFAPQAAMFGLGKTFAAVQFKASKAVLSVAVTVPRGEVNSLITMARPFL
ncbi:MAG: hypothetical protein R2939_06680 [Kofleriaceae bacterium]